MPPNFPEFAERMEASLSEVSEAGASNPSLQEKKESSSALTESSGPFDHREPQSESVTLEHMSKSVDIPEVQDGNLRECQDFRFQQHSENSPHEFQPLECEAAAASGNSDEMQEHRFSSATWPRARKTSSKGGFSEKQHPPGDTACTVELPPLSPCLSEELLDPELHILLTPSLREKTESELKFEEDERWIMMEAEEEWEEEKLSERRDSLLVANEKTSLTGVFEEREQANTVAVVEVGSDCSSVSGTSGHLARRQVCCADDLQPTGDPKGIPADCTCAPSGEGVISEMKNRAAQGLEGLTSGCQCPTEAERLSDTDSVQMFLELEKECLCEEGVTSSVGLLSQASSEGLAPSQDAEDSLLISHFPGAALEKEQHVGLVSVRIKDHDTGLDGEYCNALDSSQVPKAIELSTHPDSRRDTSTVSKECEKVPFSPKIGGEFKSLADLEPLGELDTGGLLNSDPRASCEEKLPAFIASELAKENGNLSQVDCSQTKGNVEVYMEKMPLSFAFNCEQDVTSGPEVEVLSSDSNLLTDEIRLESGKGAIINPENNNPTSLESVEPCELSTEKVCDDDDDGETRELLENGAPGHFLRNFQRTSPESGALSLHLLAGAETMNDGEPELSMASSQEGEMEMRELESTLNIFPEEQVTKASNTVPGAEGWGSSRQEAAPVAVRDDVLGSVVPVPGEDSSAVAVSALEGPAINAPASEGTAVAAPLVSFPDEDSPVAAPVVILEEDVTAAALSAPEQADASSGAVPPMETVTVPGTGEDVTSEEPDPQAAAVFLPEELAITTLAGPTSEEPSAPTVVASTAEEPGTPLPAGPTPEESAAPTLEEPTPEKPPTQVVSVSIPECPVTPATTVPAVEEMLSLGGPFLGEATHTESVPIAEETPVLEDPSSPEMWVKEDLDPSAFGIKEMPGSVLHGKVPLATTDGLNSPEVIVAHFIGRKA
uniref:Uncharacterized protein n=1 Tax=Peromyscus maniculatus bairdii TaxID=230844 RepID=A0A8C8UHY0_PERMB